MNANRNWTYLTVTTIVRLYMLGALAISFGHIISAAHLLQLHGWQAYTVPFAIDGFAVLGMIGRSRRFAASTQRTGFRLQALAGIASLAANVYAGHTLGERLYGALIVTAFVVAEWYAGKLAPAPAPAGPTAEQLAAAELAAKRSAAATKAAATKAAKRAAELAAQQAEADRKAKAAERRRIARQVKAAELAALETAYAAASAPISPAPGEAAAYL